MQSKGNVLTSSNSCRCKADSAKVHLLSDWRQTSIISHLALYDIVCLTGIKEASQTKPLHI